MKRNSWASRFGAKRRAIDKAILAAAERQIALEEAQTAPEAKRPSAAISEPSARDRIAAAFGRTVQ